RRHDARVGGVDAIDVGVDVAEYFIGREARDPRSTGAPKVAGLAGAVAGRRVVFHDGGGGAGGRGGAAAAGGGDVLVLVDALEAGHDDDLALLEGPAHALRRDALDARLGVGAVGDDADLGASETHRRLAQRLDGHGQKRNGDLFAGGQEHVHL